MEIKNVQKAGPLGILLAVLLLLSIGTVGISSLQSKNSTNQTTTITPITNNSTTTPTGPQGLQLYTFNITPSATIVPHEPTTPTITIPVSTNLPTPTEITYVEGVSCDAKNADPATCTCTDTKVIWCAEDSTVNCVGGCQKVTAPHACVTFCPNMFPSLIGQPGCQAGCWEKPVVYLYPPSPITVSVTVNVPGYITVSDPLYPVGGWKNIHAFPNGNLQYEGKSYKELFYESSVNKQIVPQHGVTISQAALNVKLDELLTHYGFSSPEKQEFLAYWLPRLHSIRKPYIFVGILTTDEKNSIDSLEISPKPDTFISLFAYFKGMDLSNDAISSPILPASIQRTGFTVVEWGGQLIH